MYTYLCYQCTELEVLHCKFSPVTSIEADVPLAFSTVQLYLPEMSLTDWAMVSTVSYVPVTGSVTTCVCWYVALIVITAPSFLQVTVVAGPPVEVQVRDLVVSPYTSVVAVGVPTITKIASRRIIMMKVVKYRFNFHNVKGTKWTLFLTVQRTC